MYPGTNSRKLVHSSIRLQAFGAEGWWPGRMFAAPPSYPCRNTRGARMAGSPFVIYPAGFVFPFFHQIVLLIEQLAFLGVQWSQSRVHPVPSPGECMPRDFYRALGSAPPPPAARRLSSDVADSTPRAFRDATMAKKLVFVLHRESNPRIFVDWDDGGTS